MSIGNNLQLHSSTPSTTPTRSQPPPPPPMSTSASAATTTTTHLPSLLSDNLKLIPTITTLLHTLNPPHPTSSTPQPTPTPLHPFIPHLTPPLLIQTIKTLHSPYHSLFFFNFASSYIPLNQECFITIADHLLKHKKFALAKELLGKYGKNSDFFVGKFIKVHGDLGQIRSAVTLLNKIKKREFGFCLFSYNALLGVLVKHDRVFLAWGFFGVMIKEGVVKPDVSSYTTMIKGFCRVGLVGFAKKVFDKMECDKNLVCYNTMINGFVKRGLMVCAMKVVGEMLERGVEGCMPDVVTYGTLIDGYCKNGELGEALRCFDEMVERGCDANQLVYNALINGLCMNGKVDQALRMMSQMRLIGFTDELNAHTSLMKGYCIAGRSEEAIRHFKEMYRLNLKIDGKAYAVIVNEYCKLKRPDEALALMKEMKERDINPSVASYNAVLRCLVDRGELDKAIHVLKQMRQLNCEPNYLSYNAVLCGLARAKGMMEEMEFLVTNMRQSGKGLDATLYSCLIKAYSETANDKMALQIFQEMVDERYVIDLESFTVFVKELCSRGKVFEVEQLFDRMKQSCHFVGLEAYERILNEFLLGIGVN